MRLDLDKVRANARAASDEDLLDRVTVYREGMEPQAVPIFEAELRDRGVGPEQIEGHAQRYQGAAYGELKVTPSGDSVLVGLRDKELGALGGPETFRFRR